MHIATMSFSSHMLAFGALSGGDYLIILFLCLLFFGSKKLPELAKGMGQAMREFKKAANDVEDNFRTAVDEENRKKVNPTAPVAQVQAPVTLPPPAPVVQVHPPEKR